MRFGAVTGLEAEARVARRAGWTALATGGVPAQTIAVAQRLLHDGAEALVSFGIAGALAPTLEPGSLLLPACVVTEDGERYALDARLRDRFAAALRSAGVRFADGDLLGAGQAAASAARKAALLGATGAVAIDLESHLVAQVAVAAGKPFVVLRAVADDAAQALPPAAVNGLTADGKPALGRVLLAVARQPGQIPALIRLAGDTRRALDALDTAIAAVREE